MLYRNRLYRPHYFINYANVSDFAANLLMSSSLHMNRQSLDKFFKMCF